MKQLSRPAALTAILVISISIFGAILYTSCSKDTCKAVTCQNGGTCNGGICYPCPNGVGGTNCEIVYRLLYANTYKGSWQMDTTTYINNTLTFTAGTDSNFTKMNLVWTNPGVKTVSFAVTLTNNSSTGSNFTLGSTTVGTYSYTGTGSVNSTIASAVITQTDTGSNPSPVVFILNNFNRQ